MITGMNGLELSLEGMDYVNSTTDDLSILFNVTVYNPSQFYASVPMVVYATDLPIYYVDCYGREPVFLGYLQPDTLFIGKNASLNTALGVLNRDDNNDECISLLLSNYMLGFDVKLVVNGTLKVDIGLPYNEEDPALVDLSWDLPGVDAVLIENLYVPLTGLEVNRTHANVLGVGKLVNPLSFDVDMEGFSFNPYVMEPCNFFLDRYARPSCSRCSC